jgi:hypothetical protein
VATEGAQSKAPDGTIQEEYDFLWDFGTFKKVIHGVIGVCSGSCGAGGDVRFIVSSPITPSNREVTCAPHS